MASNQIDHISYYGEEEQIDNSIGSLILKVKKVNWIDDSEDEGNRAVEVEIFKASDVSVSKFRHWKSIDKITLVDLDREALPKKILELTGMKEEFKEWVSFEE
jgi:hypothetical protein